MNVEFVVLDSPFLIEELRKFVERQNDTEKQSRGRQAKQREWKRDYGRYLKRILVFRATDRGIVMKRRAV